MKLETRAEVPDLKQEYRKSQVESQFEEDVNSGIVGYISIKDFAYDTSSPLHYGYFEEGEEKDEEQNQAESHYVHEDDYDNEDEDGINEAAKRQSFIMPNNYIVNQRAIALYNFEPENDNELGLQEGDVVFISYKHGQGWLVAEDEKRTHTGLVPEEFVSYLEEDDEYEQEDKARPFYLTQFISQSIYKESMTNKGDDSEWEDIDQLESQVKDSLKISDH